MRPAKALDFLAEFNASFTVAAAESKSSGAPIMLEVDLAADFVALSADLRS